MESPFHHVERGFWGIWQAFFLKILAFLLDFLIKYGILTLWHYGGNQSDVVV
jgi:hypothetical protein